MKTFTYVIIGGGMTAAAAAQGIREIDPKGPLAILSGENHLPYNRPPLTKKLWQGKPESIIWRDLPQENMVTLTQTLVTSLDPARKKIRTVSGEEFGYQRLLLATGGVPNRLPFATEDILYFRSLDDYHTLRGWTGKGARFGVIGGGFIGSEIAAALAAQGEQVTMVFPEPAIGWRIYPADLARFITDYYRQKGVEVHSEMRMSALERSNNQLVLRSEKGQAVAVDHIVAGIGIRPNVELAQAAGVQIGGPDTGGGILVDEFLQTNQPDIYAAGDAATFYNPALNRRMRVEHEDNANTMGRIAGLNMAARPTPYHHLPFFYSDLFDLGYEAVGDLDSRLDTFADWKDPYHEGVVYYMRDDKVRGILLWNTWGQVDAARKIITEGRSFGQLELKGRIPEAGK